MVVTIKEALEKGLECLENREYNNPLLEVKLLLAKALGVEKEYLFLHLNDEVEKTDLDKFFSYLEERKTGYPIQYILGTQEFMGLEFFVNPGVLIPRPDTETLVESVIEVVKGSYRERQEVRMLDLCTGTGAVAVSLAFYIENAHVDAVDIDDVPIDTAKRNADHNGVADRVTVIKSDLFEGVAGRYDIIVSNPPYIKSDVIEGLQTEVSTYEPKLALDGGSDGLDFYRKIADQSVSFLNDGGVLALEIGYDQGDSVSRLLTGRYKDVEVIKDLSGNDRVVIGWNN